jgi:uncharacterized alpha-E superfamily protein
MLSRVADALFWMSRYLERAENLSRFVEVNWHMTLDMPGKEEWQDWGALVSTTGDNEMFRERYDSYTQKNVTSFLMFDTTYPHSVISCLRAARENARTVRDIISSEMWEQINAFYHTVENAGKNQRLVYENPYEFCQQIKLRGMMLGGIGNDTMRHDEGWHFCRLGRYLERADKTSRILDVKYFILLPATNFVGTAYDDVQWAALLRASGGLDAYRHHYKRINPGNVAEFLLFDRDFPRAVLHCLMVAQRSLHAISGTPVGNFRNHAEQRLGHLGAEMAYIGIHRVFARGLHEFTDDLQANLNAVNDAIGEVFFGYSPSGEEEAAA